MKNSKRPIGIKIEEKKVKKRLNILFLMASVLLLSSCIPGDGSASFVNEAGFFWGIWHGWIAPLSLIISIFNDEIHIYEAYNTGFWYDFGFYMAILGGFGGFSLIRKKDKNKNR
jgi:hypothetical protein